MAARRDVRIQPPIYSPRDSLETEKHALVDSVLKELKQSTRRLQTALALQQVDLQVLERLYYKGNNQHRTSLFWRRVSDIRRFGRRLEEAKVYDIVENVRLSFWGSESLRNPKVLKGPWTSVCDSTTLKLVLQRLHDCRTLIRHMHKHVTNAHDHFNLELQTGAFLGLILTLTAISSRIAMLVKEIESATEQAGQTLARFCIALDPSWQFPQWITHDRATSSSILPKSRSMTAEPLWKPANGDVDNDIGMVMPTAATPVSRTNPSSVEDEETDKAESLLAATAPVQMSDFMFAKSKLQPASSSIVRTAVRKGTAQVPSVTVESKPKVLKGSSEEINQPPKKKKKKKKDEIDDIFGF